MESTQCNGKESAYLTSEGHNILDGIRFQNWELVHWGDEEENNLSNTIPLYNNII